MPTVEFFVDGKWTPVEVGEGATQTDLDEIAGKHFGGSAPSPDQPPASTTDNSTWYGRAGEYLSDRAGRYAQALGNLTGFGPEMGVTGPGSAMPEVSPKTAALDTMLLAGTGLAPELTLTGLAAGTGARLAGLPKDASEALETATVLLGGGVQSASAATRAAVTAAAAPGAARLAQATENLTGNISEAGQAAEATRGAAASAGATGISDAARTSQALTGNVGAATSEAGRAAQGAEEFSRLGTAQRGEAGTAIQQAYPAAEKVERAAFQEATYDKIGKYANDHGLVATADNPIGSNLYGRLKTSDDEWGMLQNTAEHKQVRQLMDRLKPSEDPSKVAEPVTWDELDKADKALQRVRGPSSARAAISTAKKELLADTPAAKALDNANAQWKLTYRPAKDLADEINKAESPVDAFHRVAGSAKDPHRLATAQRLLEVHAPEAWDKTVGGFYTDLIQRGRGDPRKIVKLWETVRPEIKAIVDPKGDAGNAITKMTQEIGPRGLPDPTAIPGVTLPEPTPRSLSESAPPWRDVPGLGRLPRALQGFQLAQRVGEVGSMALAIPRFYHGDWRGGLAELGIGAALSHPALAAAAIRGAAPVAGQTLAGVAATPRVQETLRGEAP